MFIEGNKILQLQVPTSKQRRNIGCKNREIEKKNRDRDRIRQIMH